MTFLFQTIMIRKMIEKNCHVKIVGEAWDTLHLLADSRVSHEFDRTHNQWEVWLVTVTEWSRSVLIVWRDHASWAKLMQSRRGPTRMMRRSNAVSLLINLSFHLHIKLGCPNLSMPWPQCAILRLLKLIRIMKLWDTTWSKHGCKTVDNWHFHKK